MKRNSHLSARKQTINRTSIYTVLLRYENNKEGEKQNEREISSEHVQIVYNLKRQSLSRLTVHYLYPNRYAILKKYFIYSSILYKGLHSAKISNRDLRSMVLTDSPFKSAGLQFIPLYQKMLQGRSTQVYKVLKYSISCVIMCCRMSFRALTFLEHC